MCIDEKYGLAFDHASVLRFLDQRYENRSELIGFIDKGSQLPRWSNTGVLKQFEPVKGLFQFHQACIHLRSIFSSGTASNRFTIVSTNRSSTTKDLVSQNSSNTARRQRVIEFDHSQRVTPRSVLQVLHTLPSFTRSLAHILVPAFWFRLSILVSGFWFLVFKVVP